MSEIFITSDTHFNHKSMIDRGWRKFATLEEMNQKIIDNWNSVVGINDIVYHLGDFAFGTDKTQWLKKLNGRITIIRGNHDPQSVSHINNLILTFKGKTIELVHNPSHATFQTRFVLHGHIHKGGQRFLDVVEDEKWRFFNVNIELHKYKPRKLREILGEIWRLRNVKKVNINL